MDITWYGTASLRIDIQGLSLLFDPFVPLPGASCRMRVEGFLPAPQVFITHGHFDHLFSVPDLVRAGGGTVFATQTPLSTLAGQGVPAKHLKLVKPGDRLCFSAATGSPIPSFPKNSQAEGGNPDPEAASASQEDTDRGVAVAVRRGRHIRFDAWLAASTLTDPRMLSYRENAQAIRRANKVFAENNETVVYEVSYHHTRLTVMGSLALDEQERYAESPDLLVLPYQGHSHLEKVALPIIERLAPRKVLLDHFDNSFPPLSRDIDPSPFLEAMAKSHPDVQVIVPQRNTRYPLT